MAMEVITMIKKIMALKASSNQCPSQCTRRCSKTRYHKPCMFFCQKCCKKCLYVPPGYYGNKAACPCYNNWKTKEGGPKCP
ncbi:gibberellin-regulated protein 6-like [Hibiscus syriacus]|nr:gibberellin-regulated protein 6-like [Hibiscus syriacus]